MIFVLFEDQYATCDFLSMIMINSNLGLISHRLATIGVMAFKFI